jgi:hypothetical protein
MPPLRRMTTAAIAVIAVLAPPAIAGTGGAAVGMNGNAARPQGFGGAGLPPGY